ncbi:hypothetical protein BDV98DRAFT_573886 [Pterulicium gracile]|uniref:Pali-domain-containing protein n=1 Tax=Pterulicium gracile TaxID=1884261 RepID=A0A5C3QBP2_9AGAR|nr:hypothetical protein BDV98DRAFT_573886 [Pterula gracilis]
MARPLWIPGVAILVIALFLSAIVSVSLPLFSAMDIVRVTAEGSPTSDAQNGLGKQNRFGIWGVCSFTHGDDSECKRLGLGYEGVVGTIRLDDGSRDLFTLRSSWTRGLVMHPIATAAIGVATGLSFSSNVAHLLLASFATFFAALMTLIAFAIDIALLAYLNHKMDDDGVIEVSGGPGFWLTFTTLILLLVGGCTVCFGHKKASGRDTNAGFPMNVVRKLPFMKKDEWA